MTREIPLRGKAGSGRVALVDDSDYERLAPNRWYLSGRGYAFRSKDGRSSFMHRDVMGQTGSSLVVHHLNSDQLDNRRSNLEVVTQRENMQYHYGPLREAKFAKHKDEILLAFRRLGSIQSVARDLGLPLSLVRPIVEARYSQIERLLLRPFNEDKHTDDDSLLEMLRAAAGIATSNPMSHFEYDDLAKTHGWVSSQTHQKRFGGWVAALLKAGLPARKSAGPPKTFTDQECLDAVRELASRLGWIPSYTEYERFARTTLRLPSGCTVRNRCGGWMNVVRELAAEESVAA